MSDPGDVRLVLERGFGEEPPAGITRDGIIAGGKRRLRRQRTAAVAAVTVAAAAVIAIAMVGTSGLLGARPVTPVGTAPTHPPRHIMTTPERLGEALRTARIAWPSDVTKISNGDGKPHWYDFGAGVGTPDDTAPYQADVRLQTPAGYREVLVEVYRPKPDAHAPQCIGAQSGQPLPHCTRTIRPDGAELRITADEPTAGSGQPTIVLVTLVRPNHTKVEILETSSSSPTAMLNQLVPTAELVKIADLPGLVY